MFPIRDHNPSGRRPLVTYALILANVVVFLSYYPLMNGQQLNAFVYDWGMVPRFLSQGAGWHGLISHMFLHGGWMHLLGNMLFLFIFGDNVEDELGHVKFGLFYLLCGLAAAMLQFLADPMSSVPMIGASGAIAGVMGGYLLFFPRAKVDVLFIFIIFFRVFAIPAWIVLGVWFGVQLVNGAAGPAGAGVAYLAHIGGFVAGVLLTLRPWLRRGGTQFWSRNHGQPPHPQAPLPLSRSRIPQIPRRRA
jgi:membrane associated rhomboid family serine protease